MVSNVNNQKASGSSAIQCDAGSPISGRTADDGVYQILKVNADGSLPTGVVPQTEANTPPLFQPLGGTLNPVGAFGVGVLVFYASINLTNIEAGLYAISPQFICATNSAGAVNFALIEDGSIMDAYISSRNVGVDSFTPTITDYSTGFALFWHNNALEVIGSSGSRGTANLTAQRKQVYLKADTYKLAVWVHTAFTTSSPIVYVGFNEFAKIS
jgi:hypothetical protein